MSVVVNIQQNSKKVKKIGLDFLSSWTAYQNQYFGILDQAYVIDSYKGEKDIRGQLFVLYSQKKYGRGMSFFVDDQYNIELVLNYPATKTDIEMFYKFIHDFCKNFGFDTFLQEGNPYHLDQISQLKEEALTFHQDLIGLHPGLTIFGCIYPIVLEEELIKILSTLDKKEAYDYYEEYLDKKQKQDFYYAKPLIYQINEHEYIARYALTENVPSIFPMQECLPFGYDQKLKDKIKDWNVVLVVDKNQKLQVWEEIPYSDFCFIIDINHYPKFDASHIIITINSEILSKIENYLQEQAKSELEAWLSDIRELGHKPAKIEYSMTFIDEDGIKCHIFKYKKTLLGKWYLGIVSDSGTFSEMKEYKKNTELTDAKHTLNLLKDIWKKSAR